MNRLNAGDGPQERGKKDPLTLNGAWAGLGYVLLGTGLFLLCELLQKEYLPNVPIRAADVVNACIVAIILAVILVYVFRNKAQLIRAKQALRISEERYRTLFNYGNEAIFIYTLNEDGTPGRFVEVNEAALRQLGYSRDELQHMSPLDIRVPPVSGSAIEVTEYAGSQDRVLFEAVHRTKNGTEIPVEIISVSFLLQGQPMVLSSVRDISRRKRAEDEANVQKAYFQQLFELSPLGIVMLDREHRVIKANAGFEALFQYSVQEIEGCCINSVILPENPPESSNTVLNTAAVRKESVCRRKDGSPVTVSILTYPIIIKDSWVGMYSIYEDITEHRQAEEQLRYLSFNDVLTGLYNRAYFEEEMRRLDSGDHPVGIIVCDVDGLKFINDTFGHNNGDRLLAATADILRQCFRKGDVIARIGGDEFAVLLPHSELTVTEACVRIRKAVELYNETHSQLPLSLSIGFAVRNKNMQSLHKVFKRADDNMYREKLHRSQSVRSAMIQTLMKALEARDFITEGHAERLESLMVSFGETLGLLEDMINDLRLLARFHDIGKVGTPDSILLKPGPLTPDELAEMRRHCEIGYRIAQASPDLMPIADWILKHHEWWNGEGYPAGLKGEEIPLACRILAIVDAFDAMTNNRPYRKAMSVEDALEELKRCAGTQFDPQLVPVFVQVVKSHICLAKCLPFESSKGLGERPTKMCVIAR